MGKHYGYLRASTDKQEDSPDVQRRVIDDASRREGLLIAAWFTDTDTSGGTPFGKREAGAELLLIVKPGDTVWFSKIERGFRSLGEFCKIIDRWEKQRVGCRFCDIGPNADILSPMGKAFVQMLAVFAELDRKMTAVRTREAMAYRRANGLLTNGCPGYGFKTAKGKWDAVRRKHAKIRVPDPEERNVMHSIVEWKMAGQDFESIYHHLRKLGIKTGAGNEWSLDRVKRAFKAELQLQIQESTR